MTLSLKHYLFAAVFGFALASGILTYKLILVQEEAKALEASVRILESDFEAERERNRVKFDSLTKDISRNLDSIRKTKKDLMELDQTKADINFRSNENKDRINSITNPDSLTGTLSRRYR